MSLPAKGGSFRRLAKSGRGRMTGRIITGRTDAARAGASCRRTARLDRARTIAGQMRH